MLTDLYKSPLKFEFHILTCISASALFFPICDHLHHENEKYDVIAICNFY